MLHERYLIRFALRRRQNSSALRIMLIGSGVTTALSDDLASEGIYGGARHKYLSAYYGTYVDVTAFSETFFVNYQIDRDAHRMTGLRLRDSYGY